MKEMAEHWYGRHGSPENFWRQFWKEIQKYALCRCQEVRLEILEHASLCFALAPLDEYLFSYGSVWDFLQEVFQIFFFQQGILELFCFPLSPQPSPQSLFLSHFTQLMFRKYFHLVQKGMVHACPEYHCFTDVWQYKSSFCCAACNIQEGVDLAKAGVSESNIIAFKVRHPNSLSEIFADFQNKAMFSSLSVYIMQCENWL